MSVSTPIQWTDDTINPVMGCSAPCELRPTPEQAREIGTLFFAKTFPDADRAEIARLLDEVLDGCNATEIYQLRGSTVDAVFEGLKEPLGGIAKAGKDYTAALDEKYICYAHRLSSTAPSNSSTGRCGAEA